MNPSTPNPETPEEIERCAAEWVMRSDRGLSAEEQDEYSQWLAADPRHGAAVAELRWSWDELDRLAGLQLSAHGAPDPDLLAPAKAGLGRRWRRWAAPVALALAAGIALMLVVGRRPAERAPTLTVAAAPALTAPCERRVLEDGSVVELNRGAQLDAAFTTAVRRVRLLRGEANFTVAKNPARPFVVEVAGVSVQAVGTVFNVRLEGAAVDVLVSEGTVKVDHPAQRGAAAPLVHAGQHAVVVIGAGPAPARITALTAPELAARLAWQPRILDFSDAPLAEIVTAFNAHNPVQLRIADPALATMRLSATFRSDNVAGFVRLMDSDFGVQAEWRNDREVVLHRASDRRTE